MSKIKVLNLYACLGGNRYKWDDVADIDVTAVELDPEAARLYQERFPNDKVVVADAHQFLLDHFNKFDFVWSSPPCPSHSKARFARKSTTSAIYPDFKLYEEIVFLDNYFEGKYCVENVVPFYEPLIPGKKRGRHLYWTNFNLPGDLNERKVSIMEGKDEVNRWCQFHDFDFYQYKGKQRIDKMARNLVDYEAGKIIFSVAMDVVINSKDNQQSLF